MNAQERYKWLQSMWTKKQQELRKMQDDHPRTQALTKELLNISRNMTSIETNHLLSDIARELNLARSNVRITR